jgi:hypothetical protein
MKYPNSHRSILLGFLLACCACCGGGPWAAEAADVAGYSVLKGHFLLQEGPGTPATDPDFAYGILAAVELTEPATVTNATLRTPGGAVNVLDDLSDSWDFLDTRDTLSQLTSAYGWGNYTVTFGTLHDGNYSCVLSLPNTALPPAPHLTNFGAIQAVNPLRTSRSTGIFPRRRTRVTSCRFTSRTATTSCSPRPTSVNPARSMARRGPRSFRPGPWTRIRL